MSSCVSQFGEADVLGWSQSLTVCDIELFVTIWTHLSSTTGMKRKQRAFPVIKYT